MLLQREIDLGTWMQEEIDQKKEGRLCLLSSLNPLEPDDEEEKHHND